MRSRVSRRKLLAFTGAVAGMTSTGCLYGEMEADVSVEASSDSISLPRDEFELRLSNDGGETFEAHELGVVKVANDEGHAVLPLYSHLEDVRSVVVRPGETETYTVNVDNTDASRVAHDAVTELQGFGPGVYRFAAGGPQPDRDVYYAFTSPAAEVEFTGDQPVLEPYGVEEVEEPDEGVRSVGAGGGETVTVEKTDSDAPELVFEQVMQVIPLRNILSYFSSDVEEVRYTGSNTIRLLDYARQAYGFDERFRFDGTAYEITAETREP